MGLSFTDANTKAIIGGDKTQTRRLIKEGEFIIDIDSRLSSVMNPKGSIKYQVDREYKLKAGRTLPQVYYRLNDAGEIELAHTHKSNTVTMLERFKNDLEHAKIVHEDWGKVLSLSGYKPLSYRITGLRKEPLQDITEADAIAEGVKCFRDPEYRAQHYWNYQLGVWVLAVSDHAQWSYKTQWDSLHAKKGNGWDTNPMVWVIEFEVVSDG